MILFLATIKVSKETLRRLEYLRKCMSEGSIEGVIKRLILEWRKRILNELFGLDRGRVKSFTEENRFEDRD